MIEIWPSPSYHSSQVSQASMKAGFVLQPCKQRTRTVMATLGTALSWNLELGTAAIMDDNPRTCSTNLGRGNDMTRTLETKHRPPGMFFLIPQDNLYMAWIARTMAGFRPSYCQLNCSLALSPRHSMPIRTNVIVLVSQDSRGLFSTIFLFNLPCLGGILY